ncbi:hypothetical protein [Pasteurella multocida]|uniref:hypothetical protein n=1 Tax=Pasteurella multocida TaxID=747 RepID=UPI001F07EBA2|nr:hypothetical protein [Pasteurella multocida]
MKTFYTLCERVNKQKGLTCLLNLATVTEKLRHPKAILLDEQHKQPTLLFVYETEQGKVAVKMDYEIKLKDVLTNKKLPHK